MIPALILIFALPVYLGWRMMKQESNEIQLGKGKRCPHCGAMVPPESIKCILCGRRLNSFPSVFRTDERAVMTSWKIFRFFIGFCGGLFIELLLAAVIARLSA